MRLAPDRAETECRAPSRHWERWYPERSGPAAWCTPDRTTPPDRIPGCPAGSIAPCHRLPCCAPCSRSRSRRCRLAPCRGWGGHWRSGSACGWPLCVACVLHALHDEAAGRHLDRMMGEYRGAEYGQVVESRWQLALLQHHEEQRPVHKVNRVGKAAQVDQWSGVQDPAYHAGLQRKNRDQGKGRERKQGIARVVELRTDHARGQTGDGCYLGPWPTSR